MVSPGVPGRSYFSPSIMTVCRSGSLIVLFGLLRGAGPGGAGERAAGPVEGHGLPGGLKDSASCGVFAIGYRALTK